MGIGKVAPGRYVWQRGRWHGQGWNTDYESTRVFSVLQLELMGTSEGNGNP